MHIPVRIKNALKVLLGRPVSTITYTNHKEYCFPDRVQGARLTGRVAVVSGGYGAIGRAVCACMAAEGAIVYIGGRSEKKLDEVVQDLSAKATIGQIKQLQFQITDLESTRNAINKVVEEEGKLDIWVNCVGGSARERFKQIHEQSMEVIDEMLDINLRSCIIGSKCAAEQMIRQSYGRIINFGSTVGLMGKPGFSDYAAGKAGVCGFVRSMAQEVGPCGITMNMVTPGFIMRGEFNGAGLPWLMKSNHLNRVGTCEDVAHAVVFLASEEAAFITGQELVVDGGRSLGLRGES